MPVATVDSKESFMNLAQDDQLSSKINDMELDLVSQESQQKTADEDMAEEEPQEKPNAPDMMDLSLIPAKTEENKSVDAIVATPNLDQHTVIIFDWDDTLLSSSFLHTKGYRLDNNLPPCEEVDNGLKQLEQSVIAVLTLAMRYGDVNVVTNAETGWVQLSAQKFMPGVLPLLEKINVVSARSTFEAAHPDAPLKWKYHAMQDRLDHHFPASAEAKNARHVISFGDSHVEREAVRQVTKNYDNTRTKSVKFAERPSMEQLRRQIELVTSCFQYIYSHDGDLDLMLTISVMY